MSDKEKLKDLIERMQIKRAATGRLEGQDLTQHRIQCDWYIEGLKDAIRVLDGQPTFQV